MLPFFSQFPTLHHAEFVLFIHDDQAQPMKTDVLLQQRVCPHDDAYVSAGDAFQDRDPLFLRRASRQQGHGYVKRFEVLLHGQKMLFGQNFRRSHQDGLVSVPARHQHGVKGDDGFPRSHVSLNEPIHGLGCAHVRFDLGNHALLGVGQLKGQMIVQLGGQRSRETKGNARGCLVIPLSDDQGKLKQEALFKGQPPAGRRLTAVEQVHVLGMARKMTRRNRRVERGPMMPLKETGGERIR